jgi:hypothetical protein
MAEERLIIGGKSFISSIRAAQLFGYTKDYVGQLARAGKIESQLIGRSWYVDEDSIRKHKLSVHYTLTKPKKTRKQTDGRDDISPGLNEKTIENIDLSDEQKIPTHTNYKHISPKNYENADVYTQRDDDAHDLFPRPVKKNASDALVKSNFTFESDPPLSYMRDIVPIHSEHSDFQTDSVASDLSSKIRLHDGSRTTHAENQRKQRFLQKNATEKGEFVAMDGILVPGKEPQKEKNIFPRRTFNNHVSDFDMEDDHVDVYFDKDARDDNHSLEDRPSRLLPIIGAVIIFLILTILYLAL